MILAGKSWLVLAVWLLEPPLPSGLRAYRGSFPEEIEAIAHLKSQSAWLKKPSL
jgi:hypothetical protein